MTGDVVHGDHRGRELGFPTANLGRTRAGVVPADGVYAGWLRALGRTGRPARTAGCRRPISIGTNPTFDGTERRVEAYVLDRDDLDLYGERGRARVRQRLRPTLRFDAIERLVAQMADGRRSSARDVPGDGLRSAGAQRRLGDSWPARSPAGS